MALLVMSVCGPAQAADNKSSDLEWQAGRKVNENSTSYLRSTYGRPTLVLVENACQWESAMEALQANHTLSYGAEQAPSVDWSRQAVVVVSLGAVPYGYDVKVNEARVALGKVMLDVQVDYKTYENSLEDVSPAAVVVVDARVAKVRALYSLDLPGLPHEANAPSCGQQTQDRVAGSNGDAASAQSLTWGSLKSLYR